MGVRIIELEKRYAGASTPALFGLSLEVPQGKVAAVVGRSGAGKTTLLRCLVGLEAFDRGAVEIAGARIEAATAARGQLTGKVGLVFQSFELFPHLSVLQNCTLAPMRVKKTSRAQANARAEGLLAQLDLNGKSSVYPDALSGGERQRVAIARALCMEPQVLLYDEPTSALDPSLKHEVSRTLRRVAESGVTQLVVTHDLRVAREAADLVFVLEGGRVAEWGPPAQLFGSPQTDATRALLAHA
jgi:ABC-type polar amino acid transport system ATPase subunit